MNKQDELEQCLLKLHRQKRHEREGTADKAESTQRIDEIIAKLKKVRKAYAEEPSNEEMN